MKKGLVWCRQTLHRVQLRFALLLVEMGAKLAGAPIRTDHTYDPELDTDPPMPPVTVQNTLTSEARQMVDAGKEPARRKRPEPPKPLKGSAQDRILRARDARRAAGG
jgi:hypothetical protein